VRPDALGLPRLGELLPLLSRLNREQLAHRYPAWVERRDDAQPGDRGLTAIRRAAAGMR
jgi:hypothetical protein